MYSVSTVGPRGTGVAAGTLAARGRGLIQQAHDVTQPGLPFGQLFSFLLDLGGRCFAKRGRGPQRRPHPVGAVGVPSLDRPDQRPRRLGEPVLQITTRPADLAAHQLRGLPA